MTPSPRHTRAILICILGTALLLRIAAALVFHPPLFSDDLDYVALGDSLARGHGYVLEGHTTAYRTPGYPILLATSFRLFGDSLLPVRLWQALADLLSCFLVYMLGRRLFAERTGLIAAGVFALFPIQVLYVSHLMTETVCTTILLLYLLACTGNSEDWRMSLLAGLLIGAGTLVRPTVLLFPAAIAVVRWRNSWKAGGIVRELVLTGAAAFLVISPWLVRNYTQFGRITLTSNTGVNFWMGAHEGASGSYSYPAGNPLTTVADEFQRSDLGIRLGERFILDHPLQYAELLGKKWAHFFSVDYWLLLTMHFQPDFRRAPKAGVVFARFPLRDVLILHLPFAAVLLAATFAFCFHGRDDKRGILFVLAACAYWIVVHLAFLANARYRFPIVPMFMLGAAYAADLIMRKAAERTLFRTVIFFSFALLFAAGWTAERIVIHREAEGTHALTQRGSQSTQASHQADPGRKQLSCRHSSSGVQTQTGSGH